MRGSALYRGFLFFPPPFVPIMRFFFLLIFFGEKIVEKNILFDYSSNLTIVQFEAEAHIEV